MRIVVLGRQGSGKGTQGQRLARYLGVPYIGTGDLLRSESHRDTERGREIRAYQTDGALVPAQIVFELMVRELTHPRAEQGFVLDGYPRIDGQPQILAGVIEPHRIDVALYLEIGAETARRRLATRKVCTDCGAPYGESRVPRTPGICDECDGSLERRTDDVGPAIDRRLRQFEELTLPLIDHYRALGVLVTIDGEAGTVAQVESGVTRAIDVRRT